MTAEPMPLPPGVERAIKAEDAFEKAQAKREAEERATRADDRREALEQQAWLRGQPFEAVSVEELTAEAFRSDDQPEITITAPVDALVAAGLVTRLDAPPQPARQGKPLVSVAPDRDPAKRAEAVHRSAEAIRQRVATRGPAEPWPAWR